ncbi:hypothetical protein JTB14_020751 [Gonioctena quinquepunctata]|nr:hypothetical protein JTB14_020751 [Gonioctena quinquepunctata]
MANADLPIHTDIPHLAGQYHRLKSRNTAIRSALESNENFHATNKWITIWAETAGDYYIQLDDPTQCSNGSDLPRRLWSKLNRVRTDQPSHPCLQSFLDKGHVEKKKENCQQSDRHLLSLYRKYSSKNFIVLLESLGSAHPQSTKLELSAIAQAQLTYKPDALNQLVFDNVDFNVCTIDGRNTFYAMLGSNVPPSEICRRSSEIPRLNDAYVC